MSLLKTTLPTGEVRDATVEEENAFMEQFPHDPVTKQIAAARKAAETPPVRKPAAAKTTKGASSRGRGKTPKAQESDEA